VILILFFLEKNKIFFFWKMWPSKKCAS